MTVAAWPENPQASPLPAEVEILSILFGIAAPRPCAKSHEHLGADRPVGYTGALKLLQNMHAKGLVNRHQDGQAHVYEAREPARMKRQLLDELVSRVFAGSASQLVLHLLEDEKATPKEIEEIRQMLADHKREVRYESPAFLDAARDQRSSGCPWLDPDSFSLAGISPGGAAERGPAFLPQCDRAGSTIAPWPYWR